jgi:hypothetical protein
MEDNLRKWIKNILEEVDSLDQQLYEQWCKQFEASGKSIYFMEKIIFQQHNNCTDEAMETALEQYFREYEKYENDTNMQYELTMKMATVLYKLKEQELDKFNNFVKTFA